MQLSNSRLELESVDSFRSFATSGGTLAKLLLLCLPALGAAQPAHAQLRGVPPEHWVTTWATSQPIGSTTALASGRGGVPGPPPQPGAAPPGAPTPTQPPPASQPLPPNGQPGRGRGPQMNAPPTIGDQTIRMVVHASIGGRRVRVEFSNALNGNPLAIGSAHIGLHDKDSAIVPGTDRALTFSGKPSCTLGAGVLLYSDPVDLEVAPFSDLAVSVYLPKDTGPPTNHSLGMHTAYIAKGDATGYTVMLDPTLTRAYLWLSSVDVIAPADAFAVVALGDSITDGQGTTVDANRNWTAVLAKRLEANKATAHVAVLNQGVAGNQVLRDLAGVSALARFDRDVLSRSGVKWLILFEGINDISLHGQTDSTDPLTGDDLIAAYRQLIQRAHSHGIKVIGATITPQEGTRLGTENADAVRNAANQWILTGGAFDATVDLDAAVRDPGHFSRLRPEYDSGDHIHINDAGNQAMADAIDISIFKH
jgi:lysophospholipase L1-like esterase